MVDCSISIVCFPPCLIPATTSVKVLLLPDLSPVSFVVGATIPRSCIRLCFLGLNLALMLNLLVPLPSCMLCAVYCMDARAYKTTVFISYSFLFYSLPRLHDFRFIPFLSFHVDDVFLIFSGSSHDLCGGFMA